ncbi:hypothetical protein O181_060686 [Austropuccinia psidii MF-1]|uniref:SH3 domain-containing protein n=1 Tax=Austropuccinia psidii MF-1 TaxID=1389203 RepID=A0A9Q3ELD0_9BASI|nr:hypothetical protein [Austropuccinia psidii MF-1]
MNPSIHQDNVLTVVYAVHDFQAENPDELSFSAGEAIQVTEKDDQYGDGWWQGRNLKGDFGLFPQAYTVSVLPNLKSQPNSAVTSSPPQLIMNETLSQVQNAIDQLHLPSPTTNSFPSHSSHPTNSNSSSRSPSKSNQFQPSEDEDEITSPSIKSPTDWNLSNTNPTQARALLAQKAKTQSQNQSKVMQKLQSVSDQPLHLRASISTQDFDEIELSEESDDEDQNQFLPSSFNSLTNHQSIKSRGRSQSTHINLHQSNSHSNLHPSQNSLDPSKLIQPTQLSRRSSDISSISSFKSGPFSAAAFALGLTDPSKPKLSPPSNQTNHGFQKTHQANKLSSYSLLSDTGVNPRDHSTPLATVLRMSRELTQTNQSEPSINSNPIKTSSSFKPIKSDETLSIWKSHQSDPHLTSCQENLYQTVISLKNQSNPISNSQNWSISSSTAQISNKFSSILCFTTSSSTTDSSYNKGSQSRLSSRIEPHLSNKELLISPTTSTFPPASGNKTGHNSLSSSQGHSAKSAHFDIKSSTQTNQWTVTKEVEWGKLSGLDDFTLEKFVEHEITGDVLLELDVNSLKEIDLSAFGRTKSPFFNQNQSSSSPDLAGSMHSHQIPSHNDVDGPLTVNQNSNSSFTRPYHSNLKYPYQSYYPTPDTKLDAGQEELAPHLSQNSLVSKQSSIQLHQK